MTDKNVKVSVANNALDGLFATIIVLMCLAFFALLLTFTFGAWCIGVYQIFEWLLA